MLSLRKKTDGFTLIEIVISFALIAILIVLAVPSFQHWVQNAQIRNGAEGILNGLQQARAEAVRSNKLIQFTLTSQSGWTINPSSNPNQVPPLFQRVQNEGSSNAVVASTDSQGNAIASTATAAVTFNGMGWIQPLNGDNSFPLSKMDVTSATLSGTQIRPLRVVMLAGGAPKMCDPAVPNTDTRACPF
jgi:type IV fimbrial biogenesis protein FimT